MPEPEWTADRLPAGSASPLRSGTVTTYARVAFASRLSSHCGDDIPSPRPQECTMSTAEALGQVQAAGTRAPHAITPLNLGGTARPILRSSDGRRSQRTATLDA